MVFFHQTLLLLTSATLTISQQRGTVTTETHPLLQTFKCTTAAGCSAQWSKVVLDANWRWLHGPAPNYVNCYPGTSWDPTLCPDPVTCSKNCALDGANYASTYGVTTSGGNLTMLLFPSGGGIGSRLYLLADDTHYQIFKLKNQEFSFDVDVSGLPCGTNGALYMTNMAADGGQSAFANNKAGAYMGTGYCDAQCPRDPKFINGEANLLNWDSSSTTGRYGSCCHEMDLWEANSISTAYTAHPCSGLGQYRCDSTSSTDCNRCDKAGCDFNPYRLNNPNYYGPGKTVSTNPGKMRVVTQFITNDGTATGTLTEIRRLYIRNGQVINNAASQVSGMTGSSLTSNFCANQNSVFGGTGTFASNGGMPSMDTALNAGMVLTLSVWVDYASHMLWLDSTYPSGATGPGSIRGTCPTNSGDANTLKNQYPNSQVQFSNIRYGDISSTYPPPYP